MAPVGMAAIVSPLLRLTITCLAQSDPKEGQRQRTCHHEEEGTEGGIGRQAEARAYHSLLLSILLANVQSLENKPDDRRARLK